MMITTTDEDDAALRDRPRPRGAAGDDVDLENEIDALVAEAHRRLPRSECDQVGALYARYSTQAQGSIGDQVRSVLESAVRLRIHVPREHVYYDRAVRGCRSRRPGLDRLREIVKRRGAVQAVLIFATSRLARKAYRALQIVNEEFVERGVRCIFTSSGIDTADSKRWSLLLQMNAMADEVAVSAASDHIRAAHEGLFERRMVHGTVPFGYRARDLEGMTTRKGAPRRAYEIDPEAGPWVERAFRWFVDDRLSIGRIVCRLNGDPQAPRNPRLLARWTPASVRRLLANARYRGLWEYGRLRSDWVGRLDYVVQTPRDKPLKSAQWEELRLVADALWHAAQVRLAERDRRGVGRKPRDGDRRSRPRALAGLFVCGEHGRVMYAGGGHGRMMFCADCVATPRGTRPLCSHLNRALALRMTCEALADLVSKDEGLAAAVVEACRREAAAMQEPAPKRLDVLEREKKKLGLQVDFLVDNLGVDDHDVKESKAKLDALRRERTAVLSELAALRASAGRAVAVPSEEEARAMLSRLGAILAEAAGSGGDDEDREVRRVVDELTGGRIALFQMGAREPKRGWLQGRFRLRLPGLASATGAAFAPGGEVCIDFREPAPYESWADAVKRLYDQGRLMKAIAAELGIGRNTAAKALAFWHRSRGLEPPDGRSRRSSLAPDQRSLKPPLFIRLAAEAQRLSDEDLLYEEIASRLGCDRNTASRAIRYAASLRGLPELDGRTRRKQLGRYASRRSPRAVRNVPA